MKRNYVHMEVVCIIGERLYHASGSACHRKLTDSGATPILSLSEAQAHEVGMEPCGLCVVSDEEPKRERR